MNPVEAIQSCLRKYATFSGRAVRSEFWWFMLFSYAIGLGAQGLEWAINAAAGTPDGPKILSTVLGLALLSPSLAVTWRRLHDVGHPGWWYPVLLLIGPLLGLLAMQFLLYFGTPMVLGIIPAVISLAGLGMLIFWLLRPSDPGQNQYGPNPHEVTP